MKNKYFDKLIKLLKQANPKLYTTHGVEFKNVFGAVGGYVDGRIFISCGKFGIAPRLPSEILENLFQEKDVKRLKYFSKGHIKKEYAVLPNRILQDKNRLRKILNESVKYVLSL